MEVPKLYVDENGAGLFNCPHCGKQVKVDMTEFHGLCNAVKVKCPCSKEFMVCFGLRKRPRKNSFLRGYYVKLPQGTEKGRIRVRDVSIGGVRFSTWNAHDLKVGDRILVQFVLENHKNSEVERTATVRWVKDRVVGCQFTDHRVMDSDLGFYVMDQPEQCTTNHSISRQQSGPDNF